MMWRKNDLIKVIKKDDAHYNEIGKVTMADAFMGAWFFYLKFKDGTKESYYRKGLKFIKRAKTNIKLPCEILEWREW